MTTDSQNLLEKSMNRSNYNHIQAKVAQVIEFPVVRALPRKNLNSKSKVLKSKSPLLPTKSGLILEPSRSTPIKEEVKSNKQTVSPMKGIKEVEEDIYIDNEFFKTLNENQNHYAPNSFFSALSPENFTMYIKTAKKEKDKLNRLLVIVDNFLYSAKVYIKNQSNKNFFPTNEENGPWDSNSFAKLALQKVSMISNTVPLSKFDNNWNPQNPYNWKDSVQFQTHGNFSPAQNKRIPRISMAKEQGLSLHQRTLSENF